MPLRRDGGQSAFQWSDERRERFGTPDDEEVTWKVSSIDGARCDVIDVKPVCDDEKDGFSAPQHDQPTHPDHAKSQRLAQERERRIGIGDGKCTADAACGEVRIRYDDTPRKMATYLCHNVGQQRIVHHELAPAPRQRGMSVGLPNILHPAVTVIYGLLTLVHPDRRVGVRMRGDRYIMFGHRYFR